MWEEDIAMSIWQRARQQWRERKEPSSARDARFRDLFWRPWWHPLNLFMILMPGFWGVILGAILGIGIYVLFVVVLPALLAWDVLHNVLHFPTWAVLLILSVVVVTCALVVVRANRRPSDGVSPRSRGR
jgi:hypothetical protein